MWIIYPWSDKLRSTNCVWQFRPGRLWTNVDIIVTSYLYSTKIYVIGLDATWIYWIYPMCLLYQKIQWCYINRYAEMFTRLSDIHYNLISPLNKKYGRGGGSENVYKIRTIHCSTCQPIGYWSHGSSSAGYVWKFSKCYQILHVKPVIICTPI